jgi:hypothetical protein
VNDLDADPVVLRELGSAADLGNRMILARDTQPGSTDSYGVSGWE